MDNIKKAIEKKAKGNSIYENKVLRRIIKCCLWTLLTLIVLSVVVLTLAVWILQPDQLTPLVEKTVAEQLNAELKARRIELTVFKTFPYATIDADDVQLTSHALRSLSAEQRATLPASADSLVSLKSLHIDMNLFSILVGNFVMSDVRITGLNANIVQYDAKHANYDIVPPSEEKKEEESSSDLYIDFNSIELMQNRNIRYYSASDSLDVNLHLSTTQLIRNGNEKPSQLILKALLSARLDTVQALDKLPVNIEADLKWNPDSMLHIASDRCNVTVANAPFKLTFDADFNDPMTIRSGSVKMGSFDIKKFATYFSKQYVGVLDDFDTDLTATVDATLRKPYCLTDTILPNVHADYKIADCYIKYKPVAKHMIDKFALSGSCDIVSPDIDKSLVKIDNLTLQAESVDFNASGKVVTPLSDPRLIGQLSCNADIANVIRTLAIPLDYDVKGSAEADTKLDIKLSDITQEHYANIGVHGNLSLHNLQVKGKKEDIKAETNDADIFLGSKEKYANVEDFSASNILKASFSLDNLKVRYNGIDVALKGAQVEANAKGDIVALKTHKGFVPMGVSAKSKEIRYVDADSMRVTMDNLNATASLTKETGAEFPTLKSRIRATRLRYGNQILRAMVGNSEVTLNVGPHKKKNHKKMMGRIITDTLTESDSVNVKRSKSTNWKQVHDSIRRSRRSARQQISFALDESKQDIYRKWDVTGSLVAKRALLGTPYYPLKSRMDNLHLLFGTDSVVIRSAELYSGKSSAKVRGSIRNIRSNLLGRNRAPLALQFEIDSDTLDINELITAAYAGMAFANQYGSDGLSVDSKDVKMDFTNQKGDTVFSAFVLPSNVNAQINVRAANVKYTNLTLTDMRGCLLLHDGVAMLNDVHTDSNVGSLDFNALYAAPNKDDVHCMFDMGLSRINVAQFLDLIPAVDSIMPLLNDMDGRIDADIAASAELDSAMNVKFPTLKAAMKLHGDSLVLLDSKTFKRIAKWMLFKNKERNIVDEMTVELVVEDNHMEMYPFLFQIDRYKLGVMGNNDLNLNFNYHISVLKSPIPFRFGINIKGNPQKYKIRFGGAKFKEGKTNSVVTEIASTSRFNLREQINKAFQRGAREAVGYQLGVQRRGDRAEDNEIGDTLTHEDSLRMMEVGLIERPPVPEQKPLTPAEKKAKEKAEKKAKKEAEKKAKAEQKAKEKAEKEAKKEAERKAKEAQKIAREQQQAVLSERKETTSSK